MYTSSEEASDDDPGVDDNPSDPYPRHANPKLPRGFQIQVTRSVIVHGRWVSDSQKSKQHFLAISATIAFTKENCEGERQVLA